MRRMPLVAWAVTAMGMLFILGGCSKGARTTGHLKRANDYFAAGDFEKARIEYLNVVKLEPTNQVAVARLGQLLYDRGEFISAVPLLLQSRVLSPENLDVRRRLGQVLLQAGKLDEARAEADAILSLAPADEDGILILSRTPRNSNEVTQLRVRLEELRARTGDKAAIQIALGNLAVRAGDRASAEASFKQAVALDPKSSRAKLALGSLYWTQEKTNEARVLFEVAAQQAGPASPERLRWAQYKLQTGARGEAKQILEAAAKVQPENTSVSVMLGELALAENNLLQCSNLVVKVLRQEPAHYDALLLQARLLRSQGDAAKAIEVLQKAQGLYPGSPQFALELAVTHLANRNLTEAIQRLYGALALDPQHPEANLLLADLLMAQGDAAAAVTNLRRFASDRPDIARTQLMLANALRAAGRLDEALAAADTYLGMVTNDVAGVVSKGLILRSQTNNVAARAVFEQARQLAPQSEAVLYQLVELDLLDEKYDDAMRRVQAAIQQAPKSPGPTYLLARVHLARKDVEQAEAALNKTIELGPNFSLGYSALLDIYTARGDYAAALKKVDAFLAQRPGNVGALMMKGMLSDRLNDVPQAQAAYTALLATNANVVPALNNLAYLYSERLNDLDRARALAARARELAPEDPGVADTLGWIEYRRGAYDAALRLIQESAAKLPNEAEVQYHLGMARYMTGQTEPARQALTRALELSSNFTGRTNAQQYLARLSTSTNQPPEVLAPLLERQVAERPDDLVAWEQLASLYARQGAADKAKAAYEQVLRVNPKSAAAKLGLAELYSGPLEDPVKAMQLAKEARSLAPGDARITHALGRIAFQNGDYVWANSLLSEAARSQPDDAAVWFDYGRAAYSQGRVAEAQQAMQTVVKLKSDSNGPLAAEEFLKLTTVDQDPAAAADLQGIAAKALERDPAFVPALMVRALALERGGDAVTAERGYGDILRLHPEFLPAMKRSAVLLAELGTDDQRGYTLATRSREAYPRDAELAKALGWLSQRRGDHRYAAQLLEQATRERPGDAQAFFLLGVSQQQLGRRAESRAALARAIELAPQADFVPQARAVLAKLD